MTLGELLFISLSESANALVIHLPYGSETAYTSSDISVRLGRATDRFQLLAAAYDGPNARMSHVLYALASLPESADRICQNRDMSRRSVLSGPGPHTSFYEHQYDWEQCEASRLGPDASPCKPGPAADYHMCARVSSLIVQFPPPRIGSLTAQVHSSLSPLSVRVRPLLLERSVSNLSLSSSTATRL